MYLLLTYCVLNYLTDDLWWVWPCALHQSSTILRGFLSSGALELDGYKRHKARQLHCRAVQDQVPPGGQAGHMKYDPKRMRQCGAQNMYMCPELFQNWSLRLIFDIQLQDMNFGVFWKGERKFLINPQILIFCITVLKNPLSPNHWSHSFVNIC